MILNKEKPALIAITGGIGSGKSVVLEALKEQGYSVVSCDKVTAGLYKNFCFKRALKRAFPSAVKGFIFLKVDKAPIAESVFFDDDGYKKLIETVTIPVYARTMKMAKKLKGPVFVEVPLLFECEKQGDFDRVIVVMRDKAARAESVEKRSGLKKSEIAARMARQVDYDNMDLSLLRVIRNDEDVTTLKDSAVKLAAALEKELAVAARCDEE